MSIRYRSDNGTETIVSGLTPGGDLEYGAVATREGVVAPTKVLTPGETEDIAITFDSPMPSNDYIVNIIDAGSELSMCYAWSVFNKTVNGFTARCFNASTVNRDPRSFNYHAFILYTVQHAKENAEDIALIKSEIPAGASSSNQLTTKSYVDNADTALDERVSDLEDLIPADASITNQLVSQETLESTLDSADEDIWKVMGTNGAKNYFESTDINVGTRSDVTMVRNADGSFRFSGTASSENGFALGPLLEKNDWAGYILSGCPEGGGTNTFYLRRRITNSSGAFIRHDCDYGQGVVLTPLAADEYGTISMVFKSGQNMDGVVISPMIRMPEDINSDYQPYSMTNQQLTKRTDVIPPILNVLGAKNMLPNRGIGIKATSYGVTFTINSDGSITANGTASGGQAIFQVIYKVVLEANTKYYISGGHNASKFCYVNAINNGVYLKTIGLSTGDPYNQYEVNPFVPDYDGYTYLEVGIAINDGQACNYEVFYPMIRLTSIADDTYVPYAMSNQELTHDNIIANKILDYLYPPIQYGYNNGAVQGVTLALSTNSSGTHGESLVDNTTSLTFASSFVSQQHFAAGFLRTRYDLTLVKEISITLSALTLSGLDACFGICLSDNVGAYQTMKSNGYVNINLTAGTLTYTIDVSNITGYWYVGLGYANGNSNSSGTMTLTQMKFTRI